MATTKPGPAYNQGVLPPPPDASAQHDAPPLGPDVAL